MLPVNTEAICLSMNILTVICTVPPYSLAAAGYEKKADFMSKQHRRNVSPWFPVIYMHTLSTHHKFPY